MSKSCILLYSSISTDQIQIVNSRRLEDTLIGKKVIFEKVDGSVEANKEVRDKLFSVSSLRGKYPQCFLVNSDSSYEFVGTWDEIEGMTECDSLPVDVLLSNPDIKTFTKVFEDVKKN